MSFIRKHLLFFLFLLGLLIRLSIIYVDYSWDVNSHIVWARDFLQGGAAGFYQTQSSNVFAHLYPNYPSLAIYLFALVYPLQNILHGFFWWINLNVSFFPSNLIFFFETQTFLAGFFKLPGIATDLGLAFLIYKFTQKILPKNKRLQIVVPSLILFNPAFIFNSALWGQVDSIPVFFVLLAVYWLLYKNNSLLSGIWFLVALLIKPTALVFLPLFTVFFYRKYGLRNSLITLSICNLIFWLTFAPFFKTGNILTFPYTTYWYGIIQAQSLPFVTNGAFNFWVLITQFKGITDTASFILGISYRYWGYLIVGLINLLIIRRVLESGNKAASVFFGLFFATFSAFLFLTKMHERYTLLPLVFLLLFSLTDKKYLKWFYILTFASFLNHYHSWAVPRIEFLFKFLDSQVVYTSLSVLQVLIFFYFLSSFYLISPSKKWLKLKRS